METDVRHQPLGAARHARKGLPISIAGHRVSPQSSLVVCRSQGMRLFWV